MGNIELIPFDIYLAKVKFEESDEYKNRPVIYLSQDKFLLAAVYISSTEGKTLIEGDVELKEWKDEGLSEPSFARTTRILELNQSDIIKRLGSLKVNDFIEVSVHL